MRCPGEQGGYGLGIERYEVDGITIVGHLGITAGYLAFVVMDESNGAITSGFMNTWGDPGAFILPVAGIAHDIPEGE